jgi:hypothetical protein
MRVTFPLWSPREDKLSLWVTFTPKYRSWVSQLLGWGLRPGDPAAVFDLKTKSLSWLAVNPHEKVQVGHYHLLKGNHAEAVRWYAQAEAELPPPKPATTEGFLAALRDISGPRDFSFFHYHALKKLGRDDEADKKLAQFRSVFLPRFAGPASPESPEAVFRELLDPRGVSASLLQDSYEAEVFFSIDAVDDAVTFFQTELAAAESDNQRFSRSLMLGQALLVGGKHQEYSEIAVRTFSPAALAVIKPEPKPGETPSMDATIAEMATVLALLPLASSDFLSGLPEDHVRAMLPQWKTLRNRTTAHGVSEVLDLILLNAYRRLGMEKERQELGERLQSAIGPKHDVTSNAGVDAALEEYLDFLRRGIPWNRNPPSARSRVK